VQARKAAGLVARIADTPGGEILEAAGGFDEDAHEPGAAAARRTRAREADRDRYDDWLREELAPGPVPSDEIKARAKDAGMRWQGDVNAFGATVREAGARVGVMPVVPEDDRRAPWRWALGHVEGFVVVPEYRHEREMMSAFRG